VNRAVAGVGALAMLAYPLLAHGAAALDSRVLALLAAMLLLLWPALRRGRIVAWLLLAAGAAALAWLARRGLGMLPLYAPPVLLNGLVAWLFGRTLVRGRTPLIERVMQALQPAVAADPDAVRYARGLTLAWALLLGTLAAASLVLALLATPDGLLLAAGIAPPVTVAQSLWSLFANILNYAIVGGFFALEFAWRRRRFPSHAHAGFAEFGARIARLGPAFWRQP
jgi:uncharacterized membrane protein